MKKKISLLFLLLCSLNAISQTPAIFKKINKSNGLSSNRITSIVKAKDGFIWIGSENGLNRYDGKAIKVYNRKNSAIGSNNISDILIDSKERLWITTLGGGLNLYNFITDDFVVYKKSSNGVNSIPSNQLNTLFEDSKGRLWVGSEKGLCVFNEKENSFTTYNNQSENSNFIGHNSITSIKEDANGNLWLGTFGGGLNKLDIITGKIERLKSDLSLFTDYIHDILILDEASLLIGTSGSGLLKFDKISNTFTNFFSASSKLRDEVKIVRVFFKDSKDNVWIGTDGHGLIKISSDNKSLLKPENYAHKQEVESSLSGNAVYGVMEDNESNIWIGTAWDGINILQQKSDYEFFFSDIEGKFPKAVLSIYKNNDALFLGSNGRGLTLYKLNSNTIQIFNEDLKRSIGGDYIQYITKSSDGTYWLGTFGNGLVNFNLENESFKQYKHDSDYNESISFNDIRCVVEDKYKNLWIASWGGGLNYFDSNKKSFKSFRHNKLDINTVSSNNILYIVNDDVSLWLATFGGGLEHFNTNTNEVTHYKYSDDNLNSISSDNVLSLLKDTKGYLWIGTSGGGINRLNIKTGKITRFETESEIRYQTITALVEDDYGHIWFSTKKGIFKFDYETQKFSNFPSLDNEYHINSVFKDDSGLLYFGTTNGVLRFDPKMIFKNDVQPDVAITSFKLFNKALEVGDNNILEKNIIYTDTITLKHDLNVLTFDFAALKFPFSSKCEYAIFMEGFDKNWRHIGFDRTITYTNLPSGHYNFKVKSKEIGSVWGNTSTSIRVNILKPFWLEWWAIIIYILLSLFVLYLFWRYTIAWEQLKTNLKLEKLTHEKDIELYNIKHQFFTNISHDIRTPVTLILGSINRLLKSNDISEDILNPIQTIKKNGNKLVNLVNELLDYRKFESGKLKLYVSNENIVEFCQEVYLSFKDMALQKEIEFIFKTNIKKSNVWFDKMQLEKVLYNLLSNAFKYTKSTGIIEFLIFEYDNTVEIHIKDKGVGLTQNQLTKIFNRFYQVNDQDQKNSGGFGLGLSISKEIIELHHGEIIVDSIKGKGTKFIIQLKKGHAHFTDNEIVKNEMDNNYIVDSSTENLTAFQTKEQKRLTETDELKKQTILVVEDNSDIQFYVSELLMDKYHVLKASNGKEALDKINKTPPDLIVSDVMMPVMDGVSLAKALKSNVRTSHIPIILLTARASFTHKIEGFEIGADDYITKPFDELLLKTRIKNVLKNRALLHEKFWKKELIPLSELSLNKSDEEFMTKLIRILEENINSTNLKNVNFVCTELGMSHSVLYKKIKSLTSMSYVEFVRDFKLKTAKKLIEEQNFSVLDASYHVGYSDRKYFSKLFKKRFGQNPSYYLSK